MSFPLICRFFLFLTTHSGEGILKFDLPAKQTVAGRTGMLMRGVNPSIVVGGVLARLLESGVSAENTHSEQPL